MARASEVETHASLPPGGGSKGPPRHYFTMIPNVVDNMGLSVAEVRLYLHFKRVAGEDGVCFQSYKTKSKECRMDERTIKKAEKELAKQGLISMRWASWAASHGTKMLEVRINKEIWERNDWRFLAVTGVTPMAECATSGELQE